ncbi:MAG TPA: hypothetical protein VFS00_14575, partial [Polyangiaceae bacterium]|nr:hypothetical protein [Polyangiaceae bacterium]
LAELKELNDGMMRVSELKEPMVSVALLDSSMKRVAELREPMERVAVLHQPLEEVSKLSPPMTQMAALTSNASGQLGLVVTGVLGWGVVTFLGVYFGVQAGSRRQRPQAARSTASMSIPAPAPPV